MRMAIIAGVLLIVIGFVALAYGGFTYKNRETVVQLGQVKVTAEERRKFPISPLAGTVMVVGGLVLVVVGLSRKR